MTSSGCGKDHSTQDSTESFTKDEIAEKFDRETSLSEIRSLISKGERKEAQRKVTDHLVRLPTDTDAYAFASQLARLEGDIDRAIELLDQAAEHAGNETRWRRRAAEVMIDSGRHYEAIRRLRVLAAEDPGNIDVQHELVRVLNERGFRSEANQFARLLCQQGIANADELRGLMFPARSFTGFGEKPDIENEELVRRYGEMNIARGLHSEGDTRDALTLLEQGKLLDNDTPEAWSFFIRMLADGKLHAKLANSIARSPPGSQRFAGYWIGMGELAVNDSAFDVAAGVYLQAILREPGDLSTYDRLRLALVAGGNEKLAEEVAKRGRKIDQAMRLAREIFSSAQSEPSVIDTLSKLLADIGRSPESVNWYRIALEITGRIERSRSEYRRAIALLDTNERRTADRRHLLCGIRPEKFSYQRWVSDLPHHSPIETTSPSAAGPKVSSPKQPVFQDFAAKMRVEFRFRNGVIPKERNLQIFQQLGGGVACLDFDRNGWVDFYFAQAASDPPHGKATHPNELFRHLGHEFRHVEIESYCDDRGFAGGVTAGDFNQDGWPDIVVANLGTNVLLINQGDGTFRRHHGSDQWHQGRYTTGVAIGDIDSDHLPDIVEVNYLDDDRIFVPLELGSNGRAIQYPAPLHFKASPDRVFISNGNGTETAHPVGDSTPEEGATGLGVMLSNVDNRPGNEFYVSNDRLPNQFWFFDPTHHRFRDLAAIRGIAFGTTGTPQGSMGIAMADFDHNGMSDFHVTNFEKEWSNHFLQDSSGTFIDQIVNVQLDQASYNKLGFGVQGIDFDNNSSIDLIIGQGHIEDHSDAGRPFRMPTEIFTNTGDGFTLAKVDGDRAYWDSDHLTRALATCDHNRDGRLDVVATDLWAPASLLTNQTASEYHWLQVETVGTTSERDAIGTRVTLTVGQQQWMATVQTGDGYMAKNESLLHFGLGEQKRINQLEVQWASGRRQSFRNLRSDQRLLLIEGHQPFTHF